MFENDVKITGPMKTKISNDWLLEFPEYKKFRPCNWKKRVGPLQLNIGYEAKSKYIEPGASVFNLANPLDFTCGNLITTPKSRRDSITWEQHEKGLYKEAVAELKALFPIPLEGPVTLTQVFEGYKKYISYPHISSERNYQDPALVAAWAGKLDKAQEYLDWGYSSYKEDTRYKLTPEEWYKDMQERISNPEALRKTVEEQIAHHKLAKIPYQELIVG
jgi:hypothetical protein